ncbi:MAG TPA: helicase, partial [Candidatus Marinimicrobia bacterium]|nr:helicase [Candidatus Neomarinimicrobiota bacterium]
MLLDNKNDNLKVWEWIDKYSGEGKLDMVTGYFTAGALAWLARNTAEKIKQYRMILGEITHTDNQNSQALDLLNETITIESAFKLNTLAAEAVEFLKLDKVQLKTLEPNFCHAKVYLYKYKDKDVQKHYFITGSSNLTEAGLGMRQTSNVELNIPGFGSNPHYKELIEWFEDLWKKPEAHIEKTIMGADGKPIKVPFKQYLIDELSKLFIQYTPEQIYYKILYELFGKDLLMAENDPNFNRQMGRLENSVIYNSLYDFQKKGALSLIKMLQKYNGAILADAVGLGKTWTALAVIKFFQLQGRETILLCPKKLQYNWRMYLKNQDSRFEKDQFEYFIRYHTDLSGERLETYSDRADKVFINEKPKLIVIDESHNLRNDKSKRYQYLLEEILKENEDVKILMLSATPINNSLNDLRNQFKLIVKGENDGFRESLDVRNLEAIFRQAQTSFAKWSKEAEPKIGDFIKMLPAKYLTLTDALIVARTRKMIEEREDKLVFPEKTKPENHFITPNQFGHFESFEELLDHFPAKLSGYQPAFYAESMVEKRAKAEKKKRGEKLEESVLEDEVQRQFFLVRMMYILMVKRLESSWYSFYSTVKKILAHHENALKKIKDYEAGNKETEANLEAEQLSLIEDEDDLINEIDELSLGKKKKVLLKDIDKAGNLKLYKKDLKKDIEALQLIINNLKTFEYGINLEIHKAKNYQSQDTKLQKLIELIIQKQLYPKNDGNVKVLIFTGYR